MRRADRRAKRKDREMQLTNAILGFIAVFQVAIFIELAWGNERRKKRVEQ